MLGSPEADEIFGDTSHGQLIDQLKAIYSGTPDLLTAFEKVGKQRDEGLYGKRNRYLHALWAESSTGKKFHQRIGAHEWRMPIEFEGSKIQELIQEIEETANSINNTSRALS